MTMGGQSLGSATLDLRTDASGFNRGMDSAEGRSRSFLSMMVKTAAGVSAAFGLINTGIVAVGFNFLAMREQAEVAFTTMLGSGAKAGKFLNDLESFAAKTPFGFPDLVLAAQRMTAYGFAAEDVLPTLTNIGDAAAGLSAGSEGVQAITRALGQMRQAGRVNAQDMNQLVQVGIDAWGILAEEAGVSIAEIRDLSEKGLVDSSKAVDTLLAGMAERYGGLMDAQSRTFGGLLSTIKDLAQFAAGALVTPLFERAKEALSGLVEFMEGDAFQSGIQNAAERLGEFMDRLGELATTYGPPALEMLGMIASFVRDDLLPALQGFGADVWGAFTTTITDDVIPKVEMLVDAFNSTLLPALKGVAGYTKDTLIPAIKDLSGWIADNKEVIGAVLGALAAYKLGMIGIHTWTLAAAGAHVVFAGAVTAIAFVQLAAQVKSLAQMWQLLNLVMAANVVGLVILAFAALVAAGILVYKNWDTIKVKASDLWRRLKQDSAEVANALIGAFEWAANGVLKALNQMAAKAAGPLNKLIGALNWINPGKDIPLVSGGNAFQPISLERYKWGSGGTGRQQGPVQTVDNRLGQAGFEPTPAQIGSYETLDTTLGMLGHTFGETGDAAEKAAGQIGGGGGGGGGAAGAIKETESAADKAMNKMLEFAQAWAKMDARARAAHIAQLLVAGGADSVAEAMERVNPNAVNMIRNLKATEDLVSKVTDELLGMNDALEQQEKLTGDLVSGLDTMGGALVDALKNRYEEGLDKEIAGIDRLRDHYLDAHNERMAILKAERNAAVDGIEAQIDALNALSRAERRDNLNEQLALAYDPREAEKIKEQIRQDERKDEIDRLQVQRKSIEESFKSREEAEKAGFALAMANLDAHEEQVRAVYSKMTEAWRLEGEARVLMMSGEMGQMTGLIDQYLPGWAGRFQSWGESVVNGPLLSIRKELAALLSMSSALKAMQAASAAAAAAAMEKQRPLIVQAHLNLDGREIDARVDQYNNYQQRTGAQLTGGR